MDDYGKDFKGKIKIQSVSTLPTFVSAVEDERRLIYCEDTDKYYIGGSAGWVEVGIVYVLPTATASVLGGVKVGSRLSIASGILSADVQGTSPGGSNTHVQFNNSGAFGGSSGLTWNGTTLYATNFNSASSRKLKENIKPFKKNALSIVNKIKVKEFNFIADKEKTYRVGFIADDTDPILSGKNKDKFDISNTIGILLKAVQELSKKVAELERK